MMGHAEEHLSDGIITETCVNAFPSDTVAAEVTTIDLNQKKNATNSVLITWVSLQGADPGFWNGGSYA